MFFRARKNDVSNRFIGVVLVGQYIGNASSLTSCIRPITEGRDGTPRFVPPGGAVTATHHPTDPPAFAGRYRLPVAPSIHSSRSHPAIDKNRVTAYSN